MFGTIPTKDKDIPAMKAHAARTAFPDNTQYESIEDIPLRLRAQRAGLSPSEARQHQSRYGSNALAEDKASAFDRLLGDFRGFTPVPADVPAGEARRGER